MVAKTDQKARCFDLVATIMALLRDGKRDAGEVADVLQVIKEEKGFFGRFFPKASQSEGLLQDWQKFYREVYGLEANFSDLRIPEHRDGFDRLLAMPQGLTLQRIVEVMRKSMKVELYIDLNRVTSDPQTDHSYARWFRDRQEADEELKNLSADDLKTKGTPGITLPERLVYGHFYKWKYDKHLDERNWTLCSGSRCVLARGDVRVPYVYWCPGDGGVGVGWGYLGERGDGLRSREAVS